MKQKTNLNKRQAAIAELIKSYNIEDQTTLITLLEKQYNITTNQAAISRDLRKMEISKRTRGSIMVYELPSIDVITEIMRFAVKSVQHNETMIVVKTVAGTAVVVADFIDSQNSLDILGTIAGENTVFVAPRSIKNIEEVFNHVCQHLKTKD